MKRAVLIILALVLGALCLTGCFPDDYLDEKPVDIPVKPEPEPDQEPEPGPSAPLELNVVGRQLVDSDGNIVNLHGFGQT